MRLALRDQGGAHWRLGAAVFSAGLTAQQRAANIALLRHETILTTISAEVQRLAPDEEDDLVLATAVSGHATYLVTGDTGLRRLGSYRGISVISPRDFLTLLKPFDLRSL